MKSFTISLFPEVFQVNFPEDDGPIVQDICISATQERPELAVVVIPLDDARPGFDSQYKLKYSNNGTEATSGTIEFSYEVDKMEFLSASVSLDDSNYGLLISTFEDLQPFESREFIVTMEINTPTDANPVFGGEILNFNATIVSNEDDFDLTNNEFMLEQTVVNSYDPNDKTCLEGERLHPDLIGDYVHYMIRFENTGTASAIDVRVVDTIDVEKFDITSIQVVDASHEMQTSIEGSRVEFWFKYIHLPFEDDENDGYVVFKIKTLDHLELEDTFSNQAAIYFDYNPPIITNNFETTIGFDLTNVSEHETKDSAVSIYPELADKELFISAVSAIVKSEVLDLSGRHLIEKGNDKSINITSLLPGEYFIRITTKEGITIRRFIKL